MLELKFYQFKINNLYFSILVCLFLFITSCENTAENIENISEAPPMITEEVPVDSVITNTMLPSLRNLISDMEETVVSISVDILSRGIFYDYSNEGSGTGFIIRPDGYIVTNNHVIEDATEIEVTLQNGSIYPAQIIGLDPLSDLAVIKIDASNLKAASFGNSDALQPGDWAVTIGNALALKGGPTVTLGIISGLERSITTENGSLFDLIQTDAAINRGNSGGPLITLDGEVVGINTAVLSGAQGIGFAVSSNVADPIIKSLIDSGKVIRPLIGLRGADITPAIFERYELPVEEGVIITKIEANGPADKSGLKEMDIITALNDIPTPDMSKFLMELWNNNPVNKDPGKFPVNIEIGFKRRFGNNLINHFFCNINIGTF